MNPKRGPSSHQSPRGRLAVAAAAIALVIAACGQAPGSSSSPAAASDSAAPSPTPAGLATVGLPDAARVVATTTFGAVPVNQVIVLFADGKGLADAEALAATLGGRVVGQMDFLNAYQVETSGTTEADLVAALATASAAPGVTLAAPNQAVSPDEEPGEIWGTRISPMTDPPYNSGGNADGYGLIGVSTAWDYIRGSEMDLEPVQVGVVDSGVWTGSNEFDGGTRVTFTESEANLSNPQKQTNNDDSVSDDPSGGHGSGVNVIIGADSDDSGPAGIASVLGDKLAISNTNLWASDYGTTWTAAAPDPDDPSVVQYPGGSTYQYADLVAIMNQVKAGSTVINMSWGPSDWTKTDPNVPKIYQAFYERMATEHPEVLFVATAGNDGVKGMTAGHRYPGGFAVPNLITVGNVNNDATINDSSNTAGEGFEVSIFAPGHQAVRGYNKDTGEVKNLYGGTSMAAPQVAAAAALLRSLNKNLTAAQIKDIITKSATNKDGVPVLSVDEAVLAVINLNCDALGIPQIDKETLLGRGVVDAVAVPVDGSPGVYTLRGIVKGTGARGVDLDVTVTEGEVTSGEEPTHLDEAGEATWTIKLDPPEVGVIIVRRDDNKAASRIAIETIDVNGSWAGTFTLTSLDLDPAMEEQAKEEGCDVAILQGLLGKALPMTLELSVDPNSSGTSIYWIDVSSLKDADGKAMTSEPQEAPVTYKGNLLTFKLDATSGVATKMSGAVSRSGAVATIKGTISLSGEGYSAKAVWTVTKAGA